MNISGLQYSLNRRTLEIYISGCYGHCGENCQNRELWDFNIGKPYKSWYDKITERCTSKLVDTIWVLGGEPLDSPITELYDFVLFLKQFKKEMWLWTHRVHGDIQYELLHQFDYVKTGRYCPNQPPYVDDITGVKLAGTNQRIIKVSEIKSIIDEFNDIKIKNILNDK